MEKKIENRGGNRKGAGAKKLPKGDKRVSVFCTVYTEQKKIDSLGHEAIKQVAKSTAQKAIDKL